VNNKRGNEAEREVENVINQKGLAELIPEEVQERRDKRSLTEGKARVQKEGI